MSKLFTATFAAFALALVPAAFGADIARPGTVNYVEGAAYIDGQQITGRNVGNANLNPGQELATQHGKVEVLLTPGVFLRLDNNSAVRMISPDLTHTQVELVHGRAGVEVDEIYPQNNLDILDAGVSTQLVKNGYYQFNADQPSVMVFDGKAAVHTSDGKYRVVKSHHQLALAGPNNNSLAKQKPVDFDANATRDDLYNWNSLRSQYIAEANNQIAGAYVGGPGYAPGWYWDPYMWNYTYLGAGPFYSPFGWGFYPFGWGRGFYGYRGGFYGYRGGFYGGAVRGGFAGGGFHGGGGGRR